MTTPGDKRPMTNGQRNTRDDVVRVAGRMFAQRGYHGTSMRELGRELGLQGSSLYSHVSSKEDLLVDVVRRGAAFFSQVVESSRDIEPPLERLRAMVAGHIDVVLDHVDEARTFLDEARSLDAEHRAVVMGARDRYEMAIRETLNAAKVDGEFPPAVDPKLAAIFILSIVNAIDRWYRDDGPLDRTDLVDQVMAFVGPGLSSS